MQLGYDLSLSTPSTWGGLSAAIKALFAAGEQGAWYDPSGLTTLFQDSAGTTPVTAVEQPMGLMLDKRLGLVAGGSDHSNAYNQAGWIADTGTSIVGTTAVYTAALSTKAVYRTSLITLVAGKYYEAVYTIDSISAGGIKLFIGSTVSSIVSTTPGTYTERLGTSAANQLIALQASGTTTAVISSFSIKEVTGNHATQATAASRFTLSARVNLLTKTEDFSDAAWTKTTATITTGISDPLGGTTAATLTATAAFSNIYFTVSAGAGNPLTSSVYIRRRTGSGDIYFRSGTDLLVTVTSSWTRITPTGTSSGGNDWVLTLQTSGDAVDIWRPQLELGSTATTYQRVNTATDYSAAGFPYYAKTDGIDDSMSSATGGGGTAGFFLCQAIKPTGGAGTNRTIWSDTALNSGYRVRINAANQLELAAGNGTPLTPSVANAPTTSTTDGTLAAATYFYVITALNAKGESLKSNEVSVATTGTTSSNTVTWSAVTDATSYRIYRGTATGAQNVFYAVGNVLTFLDTGAANTAGTPPTITDTAFTKLSSTATVDVGTTSLITVWDDGTNLNVQIGSAAAQTVARPVVTAGTASFTLGKDNGAATSFFTGNLYPEVYRQNSGLTATQRTSVQSYCKSKAGL